MPRKKAKAKSQTNNAYSPQAVQGVPMAGNLAPGVNPLRSVEQTPEFCRIVSRNADSSGFLTALVLMIALPLLGALCAMLYLLSEVSGGLLVLCLLLCALVLVVARHVGGNLLAASVYSYELSMDRVKQQFEFTTTWILDLRRCRTWPYDKLCALRTGVTAYGLHEIQIELAGEDPLWLPPAHFFPREMRELVTKYMPGLLIDRIGPELAD